MEEDKKYKISKGIFIISLVPYIALLLYAVYSYIFGTDIGSWLERRTVYGWEAFIDTIIVLGLVSYSIIIPIFPICIIYQLIFLLKRYKRKEQTILKRITIAIMIIIIIILIIFIGLRIYINIVW